MIITFLTYDLLLLFALLLPAGKLINRENSELMRYETDGFRWNIRVAFILLFIILLAGTREAKLGTDFNNYLTFYNYILKHGKIGYFFKESDIGWEYLNLIFGQFGIPSGVFFGLVSGITWFFFIKGSYKFQFLLPLMFFFVFSSGLFFWTFNGVRQSISIMIFFYAIRFVIEQDLRRYLLLISIASLFHISVIIMLPFYFITKIKFNQKLVALLYIISLFLVGNSWFMSIMSNVIIFVGSKIDILSVYIHYIEANSYAINEERTSSGLGVLIRIATTVYILYKSEYVLKQQPKLMIYYVLFFIGAILSNVFFAVEIIGRVLQYFNICFAIVIASTVYYSTSKYERIVNTLLMGVYFILFNKQLISLGA